jgi:hypothetical protein
VPKLNDHDRFDWIDSHWVTIVLIVMVILCLSLAAQGASVCLSKKEARSLWPRAHLYWYSKDRCWSNRRGPPRNIRIDPILTRLAGPPTAAAPTAVNATPMFLVPDFDVFQKFLPWEQRVAGSFR